MKNEVVKAELLDNEISVIEQSHKSAILSVHENMQQLVSDCLSIEVYEDDKKSYDRAVELKRIVKSTHVAIEKKRKELKQPLIDYGKRLDKWVEEIYTPLVNAEKIVKNKMEIYEQKQETLKQQRKIEEEKKQAEEQLIEEKLKELNSILGKINSAKSKKELNDISTYLEDVVLSEFGKKSDEAGFILNQLRLTCSMASRLIKDEEEQIVETTKINSTPITSDLIDDLKNSINIADNAQIKNEITNKNSETNTNEITTSIDLTIEEKETVKEIIKDFEEKEKQVIKSNQASDEQCIEMIDKISNFAFNSVVSLIDDTTKVMIEDAQFINMIDYSENKNLIIIEVRKRIGVLLSKIK